MIENLMKRIALNSWRKIWNKDKYEPMPNVDHVDFYWNNFSKTGRVKLKLDVALKKGLFNDAVKSYSSNIKQD